MNLTRRGRVGLGVARRVAAGQSWPGFGTVRQVGARQGAAGQSRPGVAGQGEARLGTARLFIHKSRGFSMTTVTKTSSNGKPAEGMSTDAPLLAIDRIAEETIQVPIIGVTPLIMHRFSEKAKRQMLDAAQGKQTPKQPKDPQAEYEAAFYRVGEDKYGLPADAFKQATVGAARFYGKAVSMTALKQFVFVRGELGDDGRALVVISGAEPKMREDVVRVGRGGTDLRYRPEFYPWSATLDVTYFTSVITRGSVLSLIDAGGLAIGVGEWRPERDGTFGTYRIDPDRAVEVVS